MRVSRSIVVGTVVLAVLYAAAAKLSFALAFVNTSIAPVWLPSGLAVAAVLRFGYRALPGVWLGAFVFNASTSVPVWLALLYSLGNAGEAAAAAGLLHRVGFRLAVDRIRDVLALAGLGAGVATAVSATCGVAGLLLGGLVEPAGAGSAWLLWWSGDGIGVFAVTPVLLLVWSVPRRSARLDWRRFVEAALLAVVLVAAVSLGLRGGPVRPLLVFPVLVWAAIRFRRAGANVASLLISAVVVAVSSRGAGPFAGPSAVDTLLATQTFIAILMISSLLLAAMTVERERITVELRDERARLREAQQVARLGSWEWDVGADVVRCSDELADIFGVARGTSFSSQELLDRVPHEDRPQVETAFSAAAPFTVECRVMRPDGQLRTLNVRGVPAGDGTRVFGTGLDVTEVRAAQDAVLEQQVLTQAIIDTAADAFVSIDERGVVTGWNRSAEALFGWRGEEAVGQPLAVTIVPPAAREAHLEGLRRVVAGGPGHLLGQRLEVTGLCRDGREVPVELTVSRARTSSGPRFHAFIRDLSDRRRVEQVLAEAREETVAATRRQSELLAAMGHQVRTPLNAVIGLTDLALTGRLDPEQRNRVVGVQEAGRALLGVVDNILDYARIEVGQFTLATVDFDLDTVLRDVTAAVRAQADLKGLALAASRDPGVPARLRGDPARLRRVLLDLVTNAVGFTDHGGVTIHASDAHPMVRFDVTDTGPGIAEHQFAAVFEPFVRLDPVAPGAAGLGLAIARRLTEALGGQLTVSSRAGGGSTFSCTVPLGAAIGPEQGRTGTPAPGRGARLLLAEDDRVNQVVAVDVLTGQGYHVDVACNGIQAVTMAARQRYAAILMDCQMPLMDGYAATVAVRAQEPPGARTPIIALMNEDDRERWVAAGMDDSVVKPVDFDALVAAVARWVDEPVT